MKYSFLLNITCNDQDILDEIAEAIPSINDTRVDPDDYRPATQSLNDVGDLTLNAMVIFHLESDRDDMSASIESITGVLVNCEIGTKFQHLDTTHRKEGIHIVADGPCEPTLIMEVVA